MNRLNRHWAELISRTDYERCARPRAARFDLDGMRGLVERLGHPERAAPVLHVAGSKGKGSTCHFLEQGLRAAGRRTGLYTSPHLSDWRERIVVDGQLLDDAAYADAFEEVLAAAADGETFFDLMTAAAFCAFRAAGVEVAVIEVGLGGRADSTNVVQPLAAVVTAIEREHVDVLGDSLAGIAGEKCGIYKRGAQAWCGAHLPAEARAVAESAAAAVGERLRVPPPDGGDAWQHPIPAMRGNLALADAVLAGLPGGLASAAEALRTLPADRRMLPGRWETRHAADGRPVVFDLAHTEASLSAVLHAFRERWPNVPRGVVFALRDDKDAAALARALGPAPPGETWWTVPAGDHPRSADPTTIAPLFGARPLARPELPAGPEVLLVTGSTYLVGALRPATRP